MMPSFAFADTNEVEAIQQRQDVPDLIKNLRPMINDVVPITDEERLARIAKAQKLMGEQKIDAIYIESGTTMYYFTGMRWGQSERMFALVIPQRGDIAWVCPKFEEERARELIKIGANDIRTWEEDESPYQRVAQIFKDRGMRSGRIGIEERVRFFFYDGIRQAALEQAKAVRGKKELSSEQRQELLRLIKRFAKTCRSDRYNSLPAELVMLLYYASISAALVRLGQPISDLPPASLRRGMTWLSDQSWVEEEVKSLLRDGLRYVDTHCTASAAGDTPREERS